VADLARVRDSLSGADHDFPLARGASAVGRDALLLPELLLQDERRAADRARRGGRAAGCLDHWDESAGPKALWGESAAQQEYSAWATSAQEPLVVVAVLAKKQAEEQPQERKAKLRGRPAWLPLELVAQAEPVQPLGLESQQGLPRGLEISPQVQARSAQQWAARLPVPLEPPKEPLAVPSVAPREMAPQQRVRAAPQGASAPLLLPLP
jgi:hypothetical protein